MNNSVFKRFTRVADFRGRLAQLSAGLFTLFFIASCAGNGEPLTNPEPKAADGSPATAAQNYYDYSEAPAASAQASTTPANPSESVKTRAPRRPKPFQTAMKAE